MASHIAFEEREEFLFVLFREPGSAVLSTRLAAYGILGKKRVAHTQIEEVGTEKKHNQIESMTKVSESQLQREAKEGRWR